MKKIMKQISVLAALLLLVQIAFPLSSLAYDTEKIEPIYQENPDPIIENPDPIIENPVKIEPRMWQLFLRGYVKEAIEDKMGKEIKKRIGDEVSEKVIPRMQDAAMEAADQYGYGGFVGARKSGSTVNQGQHIFEVLGPNGKPVLRGDVHINPARNTTTWHWHTKEDGFEYHYGQIQLKHDSLPNWGK